MLRTPTGAYHRTPREDIGLTDKLKRSLLLIDVELVDHVIVGEKVLSFADRGWIAAPTLALHALP